MREKGIHIWDGFPCFVTESHTKAELERIAESFKSSANELITAGFFKQEVHESSIFIQEGLENSAAVPGARLGRDRDGNPAWFIIDPEQPGKYLQVKHKNL
jgi:hypothetical protein